MLKGAKMHIDGYVFGRIIIDGKTYTTDVIIYPDRVDSSWWRKEGHYLSKEDLPDIAKAKPDILVIGTGNMGVMLVPESTIKYFEKQGIEVHAAKTGKAVEIFNELASGKKVIAAFHLTC
jgi:hypothetical protein